MAFTDEAIRALVGEAKFSDPEATRLLTEYLITHRDRIGETYFAKVLPLDNFLIEDGRITFEDLQIKYGLGRQARLQSTGGHASTTTRKSTLRSTGSPA